MRLPAQIAATAVLALALGGGWLWLSGSTDPAVSGERPANRSGATPVMVEKLSFGEDRVVLRAVGNGEAYRAASIYPTVEGKVVEVLFKAEQRVRKGKPLVRLNDEHERLAVQLARVAEKETRRQLKRYQKLRRTGAVTAVALESTQTKLESDSLRLAQALADLEDRTVYAPFDGVIGLPEIDPGDRVTDETLIATLDDRRVIVVEFAVPEEYADRIKLGDSISVTPWTGRDREHRGTVSAVNSRIDAATRSLRVEARIPNPDETIRPGTSFDVRLEFVGGSYPSIPEVAVLWSRDGAYLWRVVDNEAEKVFVRLVRRKQGRLLVDGPLKEGDLIVVEGVQGLRGGQKVRPLPFEDRQAGGARTTSPSGLG